MPLWTEQEVSTLLSMWPTSSRLQLAEALHRSPPAIGSKLASLHKKGLLEGTKNNPKKTARSITISSQDFEAVKMDYCRKHHIDNAQLTARLEADSQLAAKLYRLAISAKITRGGTLRSAG